MNQEVRHDDAQDLSLGCAVAIDCDSSCVGDRMALRYAPILIERHLPQVPFPVKDPFAKLVQPWDIIRYN